MFHLRKISTLFAALSVLVVMGAAARADEPTLLERLSAETTRLSERARRATVRVSAPGVTSEAVLVGSPPRLVTTFVPIGPYEEIAFVLPDGRSGRAQRIAGERELDIAVYQLPADVDAAGTALVPEARWALPAGRIAVLGGGQARLLLTEDTRGPRDGLRVGDEDASGVLLAADGALLGLRPGVTPAPGHFLVSGTISWPQATTVQSLYTLAAGDLVVAVDRAGVYRLATPEKERKATVDRPVRGAEGQPSDRPEFLVSPWLTSLSYGTPSRQPVSVLTPKTFLPGALIHRVLEDLTTHGTVRHAYLGVVPAAPEAEAGAMLVTVLPGSPAARAGLREGEIVTSVDGEPVANVAAFTRQLVLREPGEAISFLIRGRAHPVRVVLGVQEDARRRFPTPDELGFEVVSLSPELRFWLGVNDAEQGVAVRTVREGSPAAKVGLKRGDVILRGGDQPTRDVEELLAALAAVEEQIVLMIRRDGSESPQLLALRLPPSAGVAEPR